MENKKTKLTISGIAKKSIKNIEIAKTQGKNSRIIEKKSNKFSPRLTQSKSGGLNLKTNNSFNRNLGSKLNFSSKPTSQTNDFERRKLAEQRATKRIKGENQGGDKKQSKTGSKKRELNY